MRRLQRTLDRFDRLCALTETRSEAGRISGDPYTNSQSEFEVQEAERVLTKDPNPGGPHSLLLVGYHLHQAIVLQGHAGLYRSPDFQHPPCHCLASVAYRQVDIWARGLVSFSPIRQKDLETRYPIRSRQLCFEEPVDLHPVFSRSGSSDSGGRLMKKTGCCLSVVRGRMWLQAHPVRPL